MIICSFRDGAHSASSHNPNYWNDVAKTWQHTSQQKVLRSISDVLNNRLFGAWLPTEKVQRLLKTDLFDESLTDGLYPLLSQHTENVVGIDISVDTVTAAKQRHQQLKAIPADVRHMPFASESFDIIISNSTLDHFETSEDIIAGLLELKRVLKKDGQLLITLDNHTNPLIFIRNALPYTLLSRLGLVPYYTGVTFGACRLKRALEELDFTVKEVTSFWHFPRFLLVTMMSIVDRYFSDTFKQRLINAVLSFEFLSKWPTKYVTGQFVAARAIKGHQ